MGCLFSRSTPPAPPRATTSKLPTKTRPNFGKPAGLNRDDFVVKNVARDSFVCKHPGSINGQQFMVEDCADATIFLLDHMAQLTVDNCTNTILVTGPVEGSVFLRDCTNCCFVVACQQLRLRNCTDCKILLFASTGPIIEASSGVGFGCYPLSYFDLVSQFERAGLDPFQNGWQVAFDFTPAAAGPQNYHCLPLEVYADLPALLQLDRTLPDAADRDALVAQGYSFLDRNGGGALNAVPNSYGLMAGWVEADIQTNDGRRCALVLAPIAAREDVRRCLEQCPALYHPQASTPFSVSNHLLLVRSGVTPVPPDRLAMLLAPLPTGRSVTAGTDSAKALQQSSHILALQFLLPTGTGSVSVVDLLGLGDGKTYYWCEGSKWAAERAKMVLEDWVEKT